MAAARQRAWPATSERASIVGLMTPCLGGYALLGSVWVCHVFSMLFVGCVASRVLCVVCWLFLTMIRTYMVMYMLLRGFFATTRKHVRREKLTQNKKRHRIFARKKDVYRDSKRYIGIPSLYCCALVPSIADFIQCTVNWQKIHRHRFVWQF